MQNMTIYLHTTVNKSPWYLIIKNEYESRRAYSGICIVQYQSNLSRMSAMDKRNDSEVWKFSTQKGIHTTDNFVSGCKSTYE